MAKQNFHPLIDAISKMPEELIPQLAHHLAMSGRMPPHPSQLNPAIAMLQASRAADAQQQAKALSGMPGNLSDTSFSDPTSKPVGRPPGPITGKQPQLGGAYSLAREGAANGLVSGTGPQIRNPYIAFRGV